VLVVNTATECGFAPQFDGLEALDRERRADGLVVLGFSANDFAGQEPRSNDEIAEFCKAKLRRHVPDVRQERG
jgi:glutathione peroxidase